MNEKWKKGLNKQKMEKVTEVNVYKWFGNVKRMSGKMLSRRILKLETVGRGRVKELKKDRWKK
jgi:hypothetical protein